MACKPIDLKIRNSCTSKVNFLLKSTDFKNKKKNLPKKPKFTNHKNKICKREIRKKSELETKKGGKKTTYLVFTCVLNFLGFNWTSMNACSNLYANLLPLAKPFEPNNAFWMWAYTPLIDAQISPWQTFSSVVAY